MSPRRREVLGAALLGALGAVTGRSALAASSWKDGPVIQPQTRWSPPPPQAPAKEGLIRVGEVGLWCADSGGSGEPVVLLHSGTGTYDTWGYQQPAFARAGYRVISYSRRGFYRSETGPADRPGAGSADLHSLADQLGLGRFHLIGTASGGFIAPDYAISHGDRLLSLTLASTIIGVDDPDYARVSRELQPEDFVRTPADFRDLGPSYRAGYPEGLAAWKAIERKAVPGPRVNQAYANRLTWENLAKIKTPTLVLTGDADPYMPPSRARAFAQRLGFELAVVAEAGHSAFWEQPEAFNRTVLAFLKRNARR